MITGFTVRIDFGDMVIWNEDHYPNNINQLKKTKILNEVPIDLFSNRPLNFSVSPYKIWSIGSDEIDNKGDQENDIVFSCELMEQSHIAPPAKAQAMKT